MGHWICAYTKPSGELWAAENAQRLGFSTYAPVYLDERKAERLLFPRYLFIFIKGVWQCLKSTYGIVKLIMEDDHPRLVPGRIIDELRSGEDGDGYFRTPERFHRGDEILVVSGPMSTRDIPLRAKFEYRSARDRCWALLEMMGGKVSVELSIFDIEPA
jgi:transcription antitermination factor NusG